jgi:hypothetical protein
MVIAVVVVLRRNGLHIAPLRLENRRRSGIVLFELHPRKRADARGNRDQLQSGGIVEEMSLGQSRKRFPLARDPCAEKAKSYCYSYENADDVNQFRQFHEACFSTGRVLWKNAVVARATGYGNIKDRIDKQFFAGDFKAL